VLTGPAVARRWVAAGSALAAERRATARWVLAGGWAQPSGPAQASGWAEASGSGEASGWAEAWGWAGELSSDWAPGARQLRQLRQLRETPVVMAVTRPDQSFVPSRSGAVSARREKLAGRRIAADARGTSSAWTSPQHVRDITFPVSAGKRSADKKHLLSGISTLT